MWPASASTDMSSFYCSDINPFYVIISGVNYTIHGCSSSRTAPGVTLYRSNTGGKTLLQLLIKRV